MSCDLGTFVCTEPCLSDDPVERLRCPYTASGTQKTLHTVNTASTFAFSDFLLPIGVTTRNFSFTFQTNSYKDECDTVINFTGTILDSISHQHVVIQYMDNSLGVCLYLLNSITVTVEGGGSTPVHINVGGYVDTYCGVTAVLTTTKTSQYYLIHNSAQEALGEPYTTTNQSNIYFYAPTPMPSNRGNLVYDPPEWVGRAYYNSYESITESTETSKVGRDGGRDMFFPEWARSSVYDPVWEAAAKIRWTLQKYQDVNYDSLENFNQTPAPLFTDTPRGNYVNHAEFGYAYNFAVPSLEDGNVLTIFNGFNVVDITGELAKVKTLNTLTALYPLSLL